MLRKKHRVPLHGKPNGYVEIESGATEGAVVGVNVWNQDGTLFVPAAGSSTDAGGTHTYWRLILEIPPNVVALAETATAGLYVITGDGASATRAIQPAAGETTVSNGDGVAGNPVVGLADVADSGSGALLAITRDAKGRVSGTKNATITGTAGQIEVADGDAIAGLPTISLADVTPTPGGTLQRYGFDAKGRRSEEEAADTDDLTEGATNLYFTDARAQEAVADILDGTGDVEIHYEDTPDPRIYAELSAGVQASLALADTALQPGDNISALTNDAGYLTDAPIDGNTYGRKDGAWEQITTSGSGTVTSVGLSVPTGFQVSGSPVTTSGTLTVTYDTGYQGYTSAEALKLSGIEAGATVGADWSVNLSNIPANITSWAGISPSDVVPSTVAPNLPGTNWDTQSTVGFFRATDSYGGTSPGPSGDYDVIQTFGSNGDGTQMAFYSGTRAFWRLQDSGPGTWTPWNEFWHTGNFDPNSKVGVDELALPFVLDVDLNAKMGWPLAVLRGSSTTTNKPTSAFYSGITLSYNATTTMQLVSRVSASDSAREIWYRNSSSASWQSWCRVWDEQNLADTSWATPTLGANWSGTSLGYKRFGFHVALRGQIRNDAGTRSAGTVIFTLPSGFRPSVDMMFVIHYDTTVGNPTVNFRIGITTSGDVTLADPLPGGATLYMSGLSFYNN